MEIDMTRGNIYSVILKFTLPLILGNIFQQLYNMADSIIVGRYLGANALAAVGSTSTIMFLILGFAQGITSGFTVLTSQRYGSKDYLGLKKSVANGIILGVIVSIILTVFSIIIMKKLLIIMNTPNDIFKDAYTYIIIITAGLVASVFYNLFSAYLRAVGNSKIPLLFLIFSAILNVILDLLFIIVFNMKVAGAAIATILSQGISAILCLIYIYIKVPILRPEKNQWSLTKVETKHQLFIGIPMALQFSITAAGTMIMQSAINMFGALAVAAYTAACKFQTVIIQGMLAIGQTMASYGGQNYGKGDYKRIEKGVSAALVLSFIYALFASLLGYFLLKPSLLLFFNNKSNMEYIFKYASEYLYMCIIFYFPLSTIFIFRNIMQGCGYGFLPMMGGVVELIARLTVTFISIKLVNYPLACFCDPAAWISAGLFTGISYLFIMKKIKKQIQIV